MPIKLTFIKDGVKYIRNASFLAVFCLAFLPIFCAYSAVYVFPEEDRRAPFVTLIKSAQHTIRMAVYRFDDKPIAEALIFAAKKGVKITLLKEGNVWQYTDDSPSQGEGLAFSALRHPNIRITGTPTHFDQTHSKAVIVDEKSAIISTANFCDMDTPLDRDFAIEVVDPHIIRGLIHVFDKDADNKRVVPPASDSIVWGPDHQRSTFLKMINGAKKRIWIYQQDLQDIPIAKALSAAAREGVDIRVLMMEMPFGQKIGNRNLPNQRLLVKAGAKVMFIDTSYRNIHAKVMVSDDEMYIGSCNLYTPSIDQTRELGMVTKDPSHLKKVVETFEKDWKESTSLTLQ